MVLVRKNEELELGGLGAGIKAIHRKCRAMSNAHDYGVGTWKLGLFQQTLCEERLRHGNASIVRDLVLKCKLGEYNISSGVRLENNGIVRLSVQKHRFQNVV